MPKEITHWWLALEALAGLEAAAAGDGGSAAEGRAASANKSSVPVGSLATLLKKNRNLFLLGSVGPDFLFYYLFGPERGRFQNAAMILHGTDGGDTLAVLARTAARYGGGVPDGVWAFLYGYTCHVAADSVFHPMVLHFVGKGTEEARYNHHMFESILDLYVTEIVRPASSVPLRIRNLTAGMEMSREDFLDLLGFVSFGDGAYSGAALASCLRRFEFLQAAFWNPLGKAAAKLVAAWKPGLRHFEPSFYQRRFYGMAPSFAKPLSYRHPVTGEARRETVGDLKSRMVSRCVEIGGIFGRIIGGGGDAARALGGIRGANLETGIEGDTAENIRYTAPGGVEEVFGPLR